MKRLLRLAWRAFRRDLRAGELTVLGAALVIAAGAVGTVGVLSDRIERLLVGQSAEVLAADLRVRGGRAPPPGWIEEAMRRGLATAGTRSLRSVVLHGEESLLVSLKAAGPGYPLRGVLRTAPALDAADEAAQGLPEPGTAWADAGLLQRLGLRVGDRLDVGRETFVVSRVLTFEPDRGMQLFAFAPRLLLRADDLDRTGLVLPASRVRHRLLVAGEAAAVAAFRDWIEPRSGQDYEIETLDEARPELRAALERAAGFLNLAALVSVLLAGVAVAMAAHRFADRQADGVALLRCVGASRGLVLGIYFAELALLGTLAGLTGTALGFAVQEGVAAALAGALAGTLPPAHLAPGAIGLLVALVTLLGFALPALLRLGAVSPLQVLRRDLAPPPSGALALYGLAAAAMLGLMLWLSGDGPLTGWVIAGIAGTLLALLVAAAGLLAALTLLRRQRGFALRIGLMNLARRGRASVAQLTAFGLGLMVLLLLGVVRGDLLEAWRGSVPPDAPNLFLVNIQPDERQALTDYLAGAGVTGAVLYPMVRGRLVTRNGSPVSADDYEQPRARRLATREFNLSYVTDVPEGNRVTAGSWWQDGVGTRAEASVETGLAEALGIALGDRLRFRVAAQEVEVTVTSLRKVSWDSFRVNFFVILSPGALEAMPATWITSLHLPHESQGSVGSLVRLFPSVTAIEVDAMIAYLTRIIERVTHAVELVFGFTLLAGLAVLFAAIHATRDARCREAALLRTLGARRGRLLRGLLAEFALLGLLAGLLAALGAAGAGWLLARQVFDLPYHVGGWIWLLGPGGGALLVGLAGLAGTWRTVEQSPLAVLRRR